VLTTLLLLVSDASATLTSSFGLSVREDYNDNIYLTETGEVDDYITKISPAIGLEFFSGRHSASLDYSYEWQDYADNSMADEGRHAGSLQVRSVVVERLLTVNLSDIYEQTSTDVRRSTNEDAVLVNTVEKNTFTFNPVVHRNLSQVTTLSVGYKFTDTHYRNDTSEDVQHDDVYVTLDRRFSKRLKGSAQYGYDVKDTQDDITEDLTSQNASLSASLQLTPATSFDASFGRSWYDYETSSDNEENFWNVAVKSKVTSSGTATLSYSRKAQDSPEQGTHMTESVDARFSFGKRLKITFGASVKEDRYLTTSREDDVSTGNVSLSWKMTRKLNLNVNGALSKEKYNLPTEEVDKWSGALQAYYQLGKHVSVSTSYKHNDWDSTISGNSYENNVYMVNVFASY
jgi:hypothetical protein